MIEYIVEISVKGNLISKYTTYSEKEALTQFQLKVDYYKNRRDDIIAAKLNYERDVNIKLIKAMYTKEDELLI